MKQIEKDKLCFYCLGCTAEGENDFRPVMRCNNFTPDREGWREKLEKELKKR